MSQSDNPPVDRCPDCEKTGKDVRAPRDGRVLLAGRGIYRCPECAAAWQDATEPVARCGIAEVRR